MKLKNTSGKVCLIGKTMILPDEIGEVSDDWKDNQGVARLIEMGFVEVIKEKKATAKSKKKEVSEEE